MTNAVDPRPVGVFHAVVTLEVEAPPRWMIKISIADDAGRSGVTDRVTSDVDEACASLRAWLLRITGT